MAVNPIKLTAKIHIPKYAMDNFTLPFYRYYGLCPRNLESTKTNGIIPQATQNTGVIGNFPINRQNIMADNLWQEKYYKALFRAPFESIKDSYVREI